MPWPLSRKCPQPQPWGTCPHTAHLRCCKCSSQGPGCLSQAGPGKHTHWLRGRALTTAADGPTAQLQQLLARRSKPRTNAQQESRHEPGWGGLCLRPNMSSEGREVTVPCWVTSEPIALGDPQKPQHVSESIAQTFCELQQACCPDRFTGRPGSVAKPRVSEKSLRHLQADPRLSQLHAIPSSFVTVPREQSLAPGPPLPS